MAKGISDISNTAVRIFLQEMGKAYDIQRSLPPFTKKHFAQAKEHFGDCCCFCGTDGQRHRLTGDHLIPMNKTDLGLEAWGNVVPACASCNEKKHNKDWRAFLPTVAGEATQERQVAIESFVAKYDYAPDLDAIRLAVEELYEESGGIVLQLIQMKARRALERMDRLQGK